jgi:hypothetical protein
MQMSNAEEIDTSFSYFHDHKGFGPAIQKRVASKEKIAKFKGKLPDRLLKYWELYGFSGYGKGLFWLVDPDEYEPALEAWIGDMSFMEKDAYHVIGRGAFGQIFLWGQKSGQSLEIKSLWDMIFPSDETERITAGDADISIRCFFAGQNKKTLDQTDHLENPLFERALKTLGPLAHDEMYGFVPALVLGGQADLKFLQKVKAVEHLVMLAQLGERQIMRDMVQDIKDAEAKGLM